MSEVNTQIDLEAFAKKVAEETAAKIAMKQAEEKAAAAKAAQEADEKAATEAAQKAAQEEQVKSAIQTGVESGADRLMKDVEAKLAEKDAKIDEVIKQFASQLEEKNEELSKMRDSKRVFADRDGSGNLSKWGKDFLQAKLFNTITNKTWENSDYAKQVMEKAGVSYTGTSAAGIDVTVATQIEQEVRLQLRAAQAFREVTVNGAVTVLPIQPDSAAASFGTGEPFSANLAEKGGTPGTFASAQVLLKAHRLISSTYLTNDIDEQVLVNLLPMLTDAVVRAHARAIDLMVVNGDGGTGIVGLTGNAPTTPIDIAATGGDALAAKDILVARRAMGKYGINPMDLVAIVSVEAYNDLLQDDGFADVTDVGSDMATKLTGMVGSVYGTPVIVTDALSGTADGNTACVVAHANNFVIPRLRGVSLEQDYEVANQRRVIVASQSLGFNQLVDGNGTDEPVIKLAYTV